MDGVFCGIVSWDRGCTLQDSLDSTYKFPIFLTGFMSRRNDKKLVLPVKIKK